MTDDLQGPEAGAEEVRSAPPVLVPQPRAPWTWIVLAALFALLIGTRFLVTPDDPKSAIDEATVDTSLRLAFVSREAGSLLSSGPSTEAVKGPSARELAEIRGKVAPHIASDPLAAKYELAIGAELGDPPNATALKTLEESKPEDRTVATVYRSAPLDPDGLSAVEKAAPEGFLGKVVVAQARSKATGKSCCLLYTSRCV